MYKYNGVEYDGLDDAIKAMLEYSETKCDKEFADVEYFVLQKKAIEEQLKSAKTICKKRLLKIIKIERLKIIDTMFQEEEECTSIME